MGYFNYFIKTFIRFFTKKFFWVILFLIFLFLLSFVFLPELKVNAQSSISFYLDGVSKIVSVDFDINRAYSVIKNENTDKVFLVVDTNANDNGVYMQFSSSNIYFWSSQNWGSRRAYNVYQYDDINNLFVSLATNVTSYGSFLQAPFRNDLTLLAESKVTYILDNGGVVNHAAGQMHVISPPHIINNLLDITSFSFKSLDIVSGNEKYYLLGEKRPLWVLMTVNNGFEETVWSNSSNGVIFDETCIVVNPDYTFTLYIPKRLITDRVILRDYDEINFKLVFDHYIFSPRPEGSFYGDVYDLGTYTVGMSAEALAILNANGELDRQNELISAQQETNRLLGSITDSNVDSSVLGDMPQAETIPDSTGIGNIFQQMYNAFCTNQPISFTFTIPIVNKSITIDSNYINHYPVEIRSLASVFYWFVIGLYVIKDVRTMINKIAEGNIENVGSDVQKEVL